MPSRDSKMLPRRELKKDGWQRFSLPEMQVLLSQLECMSFTSTANISILASKVRGRETMF
jgi:hypothetical protein